MRHPIGVHAIAHFAGVCEDRNVARQYGSQGVDQPLGAVRRAAGPRPERRPTVAWRSFGKSRRDGSTGRSRIGDDSQVDRVSSCRSGFDRGRFGSSVEGTVIRRQSVITSVKRQPTASMRSECGRAALAVAEHACPSESGWLRPGALFHSMWSLRRARRRARHSLRGRRLTRGRRRPPERWCMRNEKLGGAALRGKPRGGARASVTIGAFAVHLSGESYLGGKQRSRAGRPLVMAWNSRREQGGIPRRLRRVPHHLVAGPKIASKSIS